jgi:hypothetical protein
MEIGVGDAPGDEVGHLWRFVCERNHVADERASPIHHRARGIVG